MRGEVCSALAPYPVAEWREIDKPSDFNQIEQRAKSKWKTTWLKPS